MERASAQLLPLTAAVVLVAAAPTSAHAARVLEIELDD
jgi:hypothetical protein